MADQTREQPCPQQDKHTPNQPDDYLQWHAWAEKMMETHDQFKCPECGLYQIWKKREVRNG